MRPGSGLAAWMVAPSRCWRMQHTWTSGAPALTHKGEHHGPHQKGQHWDGKPVAAEPTRPLGQGTALGAAGTTTSSGSSCPQQKP
eukprot:scaffold2580_cov388-Prasinococcus_capsulatus_cf.AAC.18